jgi:hypothetical protein
MVESDCNLHAAGYAGDVIDEAMDEDDPKTELIEMLLDVIEEGRGRKLEEGAALDVGEVDNPLAALREELEQLKLTKLKDRALAAGAIAVEIQDAEDSDAPREALIQLDFDLRNENEGAALDVGEVDNPLAALREELEQLKLTKLKDRALAAGAIAEEIQDAEDSDAPREALLQLVFDLRNENDNGSVSSDDKTSATMGTTAATAPPPPRAADVWHLASGHPSPADGLVSLLDIYLPPGGGDRMAQVAVCLDGGSTWLERWVVHYRSHIFFFHSQTDEQADEQCVGIEVADLAALPEELDTLEVNGGSHLLRFPAVEDAAEWLAAVWPATWMALQGEHVELLREEAGLVAEIEAERVALALELQQLEHQLGADHAAEVEMGSPVGAPGGLQQASAVEAQAEEVAAVESKLKAAINTRDAALGAEAEALSARAHDLARFEPGGALSAWGKLAHLLW